MDYSLISVRYAKALFLLCEEKNIVKKVYDDMILLDEQYKTVDSFREFIGNPVIKPAQKKKTLKAIFEQHVNETTLNFLHLLVENKREIMLDSIVRNFIDKYKAQKGIKSATIYTAIPLPKDYVEKVQSLLEEDLNCKIELTIGVKENLLGGFILMVDGKMMDASILTKLKALKNKLLN